MAGLIAADQYPSAFALHQKYAASPLLLDLVWTHSVIISKIAHHLLDSHKELAAKLDRELVTQACLLHELGIYACGGYEWMPNHPPSQFAYIDHGIVGAWLLHREGQPAAVVQAAYYHPWAGLCSAEIQQFGLQLPAKEYVPTTDFTAFISYVGKFHSKAPKFRNCQDVMHSLHKFGEEQAQRFEAWKTQFGEPTLGPIINQFTDWHTTFTMKINQLGPNKASQVLPY